MSHVAISLSSKVAASRIGSPSLVVRRSAMKLNLSSPTVAAPVRVVRRALPGVAVRAAATPAAAPSPAPPPAPAAPAPELSPPPAAFQKAVGMGAAKAALPCAKILVMGIMAGIFIGYGAFLAASIGGNCPGLAASNPGLQKMVMGAFGLPFGLLMVLVCGAELYTGNTALIPAAVYEKKADMVQLAKNWIISYFGNLVGSLLLVWLVTQAGMFGPTHPITKIAVAKTSLTWMEAFTRGMLCNFLVCVGVWQASAATSLAGKAVGVWFPISAFVALGLEHSVANMFLIPMGISAGAQVSFGQFVTSNLIPVTLGNTLAGLLLGTAYAYIFGSLGKEQE